MGLPLRNMTVTQQFGVNRALYGRWGLDGHHGVDLRAYYVPTYAVFTGVVTATSEDGYTDPLSGKTVAGKVVIVRSANYDWWYLHLSKINVKVGQKVSEGEKIAVTGNTGYSTAAHLHLGCRPIKPNLKNGYRGFINPLEIINGAPAKQTNTSGGEEVFKTDQEVKEAYLLLRGSTGSEAERKAWMGQSKQRFFKVAKPEADSTRKQLANVKAALKKLQDTPMKTVIKEVEKIVEVPVEKITVKEVEVIKEVNPKWLSSFIKFFKNLLRTEE